MGSSFSPFTRLMFVVFTLGFISFCVVPEVCADSYETILLKAKQGDANAQFTLAHMYHVSEGVPQDYIKAYALSNLAVAQGHLKGKKLRDELIDKMTPEQIAEGRELSAHLENRISSRSKHTEPAATNKDIDVSSKKRVVSSEPRYLNGSSSREIARDGRFIAYANGTVLDTSTGLMWADRDNAEDLNWYDAKKYCENYLGGWYTDWRMPALHELEWLYDTGTEYTQDCCLTCSKIKITKLIKLTCCCHWTSETDGSGGVHFAFHDGFPSWSLRVNASNRVLPVRSGN